MEICSMEAEAEFRKEMSMKTGEEAQVLVEGMMFYLLQRGVDFKVLEGAVADAWASPRVVKGMVQDPGPRQVYVKALLAQLLDDAHGVVSLKKG
jgi:hypothetical protein